MLSRIFSSSVEGIEGYVVSVEVDIIRGWPTFTTVGLPDAAVRESKERVVAAIRNSGFDIPTRKITVNLAPASIKKEGPLFDLPIALGMLYGCGILSDGTAHHDKISQQSSLERGRRFSHRFAAVGELALNGKLRPVRGVLPMALALRKNGFEEFILPRSNTSEAAIVPGIKIIGADSLKEVAAHLAGENKIPPSGRDKNFFTKNRKGNLIKNNSCCLSFLRC